MWTKRRTTKVSNNMKPFSIGDMEATLLRRVLTSLVGVVVGEAGVPPPVTELGTLAGFLTTVAAQGTLVQSLTHSWVAGLQFLTHVC